MTEWRGRDGGSDKWRSKEGSVFDRTLFVFQKIRYSGVLNGKRSFTFLSWRFRTHFPAVLFCLVALAVLLR